MHGLQTLAHINRSAVAAKEYLERSRQSEPKTDRIAMPPRPVVTYQGQIVK